MTARNPEELSCVSIIVCDDIYRDDVSKKLIIVGTFNRIIAPRFPYKHERLHVLFTLTNGRGSYDVTLAIENADTGEPVADFKGPLKIEDPLAIVDVNVRLNYLVFPSPGKYWVKLESDGQIIQQRPFVLQSASEVQETQT